MISLIGGIKNIMLIDTEKRSVLPEVGVGGGEMGEGSQRDKLPVIR